MASLMKFIIPGELPNFFLYNESKRGKREADVHQFFRERESLKCAGLEEI